MRRNTDRREPRIGIGPEFKFNAALFHAHRDIVRRRFLLLGGSIAVYAGILLSLGTSLEVSGNYFVALPVIAAALGFGAPGGIAAGALGLPANLLLFSLIGHSEYSPASKPIAELFGLVVGLSLGLLADYFWEIGREMRRREDVEESLRDALAEKELLLRELQHRVKNNLNVMMSLVSLQKSRSRDPSFVKAADELMGRIFAMALVHDRLYGDRDGAAIDLGLYVEALARDLSSSLGLNAARMALSLDAKGRRLPSDMAMPLGLILNEVFTNAAKYARTEANPDPRITVSLETKGPDFLLTVEDDGPGPAASSDSGLGMKLISSLAAYLGGAASLSPLDGPTSPSGTRFELRWRDAESVRG